MSKQEVFDVLKKQGQLAVTEIAKYLKINIISIRQNLWRLQKEKEVELVELTGEEVRNKGLKYTGRHFEWRINEKKKKEI